MSDFKYFEACNTSILLQFNWSDIDKKGTIFLTKFDRGSSGEVRVTQNSMTNLTYFADIMRMAFASLTSDCTTFQFLLQDTNVANSDTDLHFYQCWMKSLECVVRIEASAEQVGMGYPLASVFFGENQITAFDNNYFYLYQMNSSLIQVDKVKLIGIKSSDIVEYLYFEGDYYLVERKGIFLIQFEQGGMSKGLEILHLPEKDHMVNNIIGAKVTKRHLILSIHFAGQAGFSRYVRYVLESLTKTRRFNITRPMSVVLPLETSVAMAYYEDSGHRMVSRLSHESLTAAHGENTLFIGVDGAPVIAKSAEGFLNERYLTDIRRVSFVAASPVDNKFADSFAASYQLVVPVGPRSEKDLYHLVVKEGSAYLRKLSFSSPSIDCTFAEDHWLGSHSLSVTVLYRAFKDSEETLTPLLYKIEFEHKKNVLKQYSFILISVLVVVFVIFHLKYCYQKIAEARNPKEYFPECNKYLTDVTISHADDD